MRGFFYAPQKTSSRKRDETKGETNSRIQLEKSAIIKLQNS